jgi:hypothetical protein
MNNPTERYVMTTSSTTTVAENVSRNVFTKRNVAVAALGLAAAGVVAVVVKRRALTQTLDSLVKDAVSETA